MLSATWLTGRPWRSAWINKDAVSEHAFKLLSAGQQDSDIAVLAGSDALSDDKVVALLATLCKKEGIDLQEKQSHALEKWRLAMLSDLQHSSFANEDKIERLQELYAEFGYPDDRPHAASTRKTMSIQSMHYIKSSRLWNSALSATPANKLLPRLSLTFPRMQLALLRT